MNVSRIAFILILQSSLLLAKQTTNTVTPVTIVSKPTPKKDLIFLDGIRVVFRGSEGSTDLILATEEDRLELDGTKIPLQKKVENLALAQEAKKYRLWPSPEETDKQVRMLSEANKKTPKEFDDLLLTIGYTPAEGRLAFAQINAINSLVGFKITSNLIVPESEVIKYYNDNPEIEHEAYYLEYTRIPFAQAQSKEKQLQQLNTIAQKGDPKNILKWSDPFWVKKNELAEDKEFIAQMKRVEISTPLETDDGFELFRLRDRKEERTKPLEERYAEIVNTLRKPKYSELMESFQKDLLNSASIIYFDLPVY